MQKTIDPNLEIEDVDTLSSKPLFADTTDRVLEIEGLVRDGRRIIGNYAEIKANPAPSDNLSSNDVRDFLRKSIGNLTIEGTIDEMYMTIKSMEAQLKNVLKINATLESDSKTMKENMVKVIKENVELKKKYKALEDEGPLKVELDRELQALLTEQNIKQEKIQDLVSENRVLDVKIGELDKQIATLTEERDDSLKYAASMEIKIVDMVAKIKNNEEQLATIKDENQHYKDKIALQVKEISSLVEEKTRIQVELKETKDAFDEICKELVDIKSKTEKFFNRG